jgi:thiamine biosynthesis lipoprotein
MGTVAHIVVVDGPPAALDVALARLAELEDRWSRFEPGSELSRANLAGGKPVRVSPDTTLLARLARHGWERTNGLFDPSVLAAVRAAGYDRSMAHLRRDTGRTAPARPSPGCAGLTIDERARTITVPVGSGLDAGGLGKGLAADLVVAALLELGAAGAMLNVGGDMGTAGACPRPEGWVVDVEDPFGGAPVARLAVRIGAVGTTSRVRRAWGKAGHREHHVIDPRTGSPSWSGLAAVTVVTRLGWEAEVLAKAAFVTGPAEAGPLLLSWSASALFVHDDGRVTVTEGWPGVVPT